MKYIYIYIILSLAYHVKAQKPVLADTAFRTWTEVSNGTLSSNGRYIIFTIQNKPIGGETLVVVDVKNHWQFEASNYKNATFSDDSKFLFAIAGTDTLIRLNLETKEFNRTPNCDNYQFISDRSESWLIYKLGKSTNELNIFNLRSLNVKILPGIEEYTINRADFSIISKINRNISSKEVMHWTSLKTGRSKIIYAGNTSSNLIFSKDGKAIAFTVAKKDDTEIWHYSSAYQKARFVGSDLSPGIAKNHQISVDAVWTFSSNDQNLFFTQKERKPEDSVNRRKPKIWNYKDAFLQSYIEQPNPSLDFNHGNNLTIVNLKNSKFRQLLTGDQKVRWASNSENTDVLVVESSYGKTNELPWNSSARPTYYLCFTNTGELRTIKSNLDKVLPKIELSPDNRVLLYFDPEKDSYVGYNINTDSTYIVASNLNARFSEYFVKLRGPSKESILDVVGWLPGTHKAIVQGTFDIWLVDADKSNVAINLTKEKGKNKKIIYSILKTQSSVILPENNYLVQGFDLESKAITLNELNVNRGLFKERFFCKSGFDWPYTNTSSFVQKAADADKYLLFFRLKNGCSNYYLADGDFKNIMPISANTPEKKYNWLTSELIKYKDQLGNNYESILYKPENFDHRKKYPVIFYYYLDISNELNRYIAPDPSNIGINIPLLVSNGYIVCAPNIYQIKGKPGQAALTSVGTAASYLSNFYWIDTARMGIAGHSLGGYETNFIVTHSNIFKAAMAAAGNTDMISNYNDLFPRSGSKQYYVKDGNYFMGEDLQENPQSYLENSPIIAVKNVTTPLLLMHNDNDKSVNVGNSKRFFVQMRSLNKPVWLVQYKDEDHVLNDEFNRLDFQRRLKEFFDHYLKGSPMARWMQEHN